MAITGEDSAQPHARADNLSHWLGMIESGWASLPAVGQCRAAPAQYRLAGDTAAAQSTSGPEEIIVSTPWQRSTTFFTKPGAAWALTQFLKAAEVDLPMCWRRKTPPQPASDYSRTRIPQAPVWSPVILNGSGFGLWANHSLVMASYISRANAALIDLRELLAQG